MNPFALQLMALALLVFSNGAAPAQTAQDTSRVSVDTTHTQAGGSFVTEAVPGVDQRFASVIRKLKADGWPEEWVVDRFKDKRTVFIPKMALIKIRKPSSGGGESASAYAWVNTKESADACREFIAKYETIIDAAEKRFGVDRETIAALMRCETRHGSVTGDYHVFSVYASMALMNDRAFVDSSLARARQDLAAEKAGQTRIDSELTRIRTRAESRSKWAYNELVNLLKIDRNGSADAMSIYGSWAGAFGWSQFLPSSYLRSAVDGNGDSKIDLFTPDDAIHSVANYLDKAGYKMGNDASRRKALRSYNNSTPYVESIMALADRVRKQKSDAVKGE